MTSIGANLRVFGHYNQGGRKYMEDAFVVAYQQAEDGKDLEFAFFGVYDGHGGKEAAQYAKKHLLDNIIGFKHFWSEEDSDVLKAIRDGFIATHLAMWKEVDKWPKTSSGLPSTAGTTASVAFLRKGKLYTGHVGDSKIVIGYKTEGLDFWQPKHLTKDHKPDSPAEKKRIYDSGGLVMNKAGVERVVWKRPKGSHLGPVTRRSTDFDKIPFLAVARSLGDLWSYDHFHKEFVVSPEPDVNVMPLDPNRDCCIILATDGLWNMVPAWDAVRLVRATEMENREVAEKCGISLKYGWSLSNPAKVLVDSALEWWNTHQLRADNTSVVTVMIDPIDIEKDETCQEPLVFRTSFSHGLMETDEFWYQRKDPHDVPSLLENQLSLKDSIEDIMHEFSNNNEDSENLSLTGTMFLDYKETSRISTASPLQSCSNILPKVGSHSFKSFLRKGSETQGVENSIRPFPRWSRSASGRTSLSKLVSWSKTVSRRRMSDPFPRRTCNNPVMSEADCTRNSYQSSEENSVCAVYDKFFGDCNNSCSTEQATSTSLSSATCSVSSPENQNISVCEHDHSYQIFDCTKCNKLTSIKGGVKRRFSSSEHSHCDATRCTDYDNVNETIYPWKRKPSSYRLSITALKALNDFKHKRQMFSVKV